MAYRFVHAADIHLDSPLRSLALRDPELADLIGNATRRAFTGIVDLCLAEQVDALLLAGDLYDGEQTSIKTARFLGEQIRRLHEAAIRVFVIRGNHDALSRITSEMIFPDSVKLFEARAEAVAFDHASGGLTIAIHGMSFAKPHAPDPLLPKYRPPVEGAINIGLMHTSLGGAAGHDPYAPVSTADLQASGFRYWALGHIHRRAVEPGRATVAMPGMPQGRDINEAGPKSICLVTVADDGAVHVEERLTSIAQFERLSVDIDGIEEWRDAVTALTGALERLRARVPSEHLVARVMLTGRSPLAWRLRRDSDLLKAEADDRAARLGKSWIEKLEVDCRAPDGSAAAGEDPVAELRRLIAGDVLGSEAFRTEVAAIADELRKQLPPECRDLLGHDEARFTATVAALAREGSEDVLAQLHARAGAHED